MNELNGRHGKPLESFGPVKVMCDDTLNAFVMRCEHHVVGATLADPKPKYEFRVHISEETWKAICAHDEAEAQFYEDLGSKADEWARGPTMRFMVTDSGKYGAAARAAVERQRAEATSDRDSLEWLRSEIEALVLQVAEMRSRPSLAQAANFGTRLGDLVERAETERRRIQEIDAMLEFAKIAILDAGDLSRAGG